MATDRYLQRYAAQVPVLGVEGQDRLRQLRIHIAGCGGLGNLIALLLVSIGVRWISLNDPQRLELENLNRFLLAEEEHVGQPKVLAAARFLGRTPGVLVHPLVCPNEAPDADQFYREADWIFCCANTISARTAAASAAIRYKKPILDVAVSDCSKMLGGAIKIWLPQSSSWSACPACYFEGAPVEHDEGLLGSTLAVTAALAVQVWVTFATAADCSFLMAHNLLQVSLDTFQIQALAVGKREGCCACG